MKIKLFSDMVCPYCYVGKLIEMTIAVMRESLYRNLTNDEKIELNRLLNKILDSGEEEKVQEMKD